MSTTIRDFAFSIFFDEIECHQYLYPNIKYVSSRPDFIKTSNDIYVGFSQFNIDRKNGVINIYNDNVMIEFKSVNLIDALNSNKAYYAFDSCDVELLYSKETKIIEAIVSMSNNTSSRRFRGDVRDDGFSIIAFNNMEMIGDDELVIKGANVFNVKLYKIPKELTVEFQKEVIEELNKEVLSLSSLSSFSQMQSQHTHLQTNSQMESDIDKIAIIACNNNWTDIFKACITTEMPTKKVLDNLMRTSIRNGNMEVARLCL